MEKLKSAHYFPLPSQGNIYTFTKLQLANGSNKLLAASLKRELIYFEYLDSPDGILTPTIKEVSFTYIPSGAEIISIDAFNKSEENNEFVIGITIIKNSSDLNRLETYLNIYSDSEESKDFHIENIAQNCLNVELNFIPYHLTHTKLIVWNDNNIVTKEVVFILTGSDNQIHVYRENTTNHFYKEVEKKEFFPEFNRPPSIVIWIEIHYFNEHSERLTAFGCECGYIKIARVCVKTNTIIFSHSTRFDNFITGLKIYPEHEEHLANKSDVNTNCVKQKNPVLNVVVVNSILPPVFFSDVLTYGMKKCGPLPRCDMTSIFTCLDVVDIDFDGNKEILIGTSVEEILLYKFNSDKGWCLIDIMKITSPVFGLLATDITGDSVRELNVLTMKGVHIFQHEIEDVEKVVTKKLKKLELTDLESCKCSV